MKFANTMKSTDIWIRKTGKNYKGTCDKYPDLVVAGNDVDEVRSNIIKLVKDEEAKNITPITEIKENKTKVKIGFA